MAGAEKILKTTGDPQPDPNLNGLLEAAHASIREARWQAAQTQQAVEAAHQRIAQTGVHARARRSISPFR